MIESISRTRCILLLIIVNLLFLETLIGLAYKFLVVINLTFVNHARIIINLLLIFLICD